MLGLVPGSSVLRMPRITFSAFLSAMVTGLASALTSTSTRVLGTTATVKLMGTCMLGETKQWVRSSSYSSHLNRGTVISAAASASLLAIATKPSNSSSLTSVALPLMTAFATSGERAAAGVAGRKRQCTAPLFVYGQWYLKGRWRCYLDASSKPPGEVEREASSR